MAIESGVTKGASFGGAAYRGALAGGVALSGRETDAAAKLKKLKPKEPWWFSMDSMGNYWMTHSYPVSVPPPTPDEAKRYAVQASLKGGSVVSGVALFAYYAAVVKGQSGPDPGIPWLLLLAVFLVSSLGCLLYFNPRSPEQWRERIQRSENDKWLKSIRFRNAAADWERTFLCLRCGEIFIVIESFMSEVSCDYCGTRPRSIARYCGRCGKPLSSAQGHSPGVSPKG